MDDAFVEKLYRETASLYHLDQLGGQGVQAGRGNLGPLPPTAVILLASLSGAWVLILLYVISRQIRGRKKKNR